MKNSLIYGAIVEFKDPKGLVEAAKKVKGAGYRRFETYSAFPIHGMDDAMGLKATPLGWIVLCGGALGALTAFTLQTWVATSAYKLVISGKPLFSYQAFVPVTFELMVLFSAFAAVFGMLILNRLPQLYHPLFKSDRFLTATSHGFFLSIEASDDLFHSERTIAFLNSLGGVAVEVIDGDDDASH